MMDYDKDGRRPVRELEDPFAEESVTILYCSVRIKSGPGGYLMEGRYPQGLKYPRVPGLGNLTYTLSERSVEVYVPSQVVTNANLLHGFMCACFKQNNRYYAIGVIDGH